VGRASINFLFSSPLRGEELTLFLFSSPLRGEDIGGGGKNKVGVKIKLRGGGELSSCKSQPSPLIPLPYEGEDKRKVISGNSQTPEAELHPDKR